MNDIDDNTLIRFLEARNFNTDDAIEMIKKCEVNISFLNQKWRLDNRVNELRMTDFP